MKQGTTPKHTFTLPFEASLLSVVQITYKQGGRVVLQKETEDCTFDGVSVFVTLTQEETFLFAANSEVQIQVRALDKSGNALAPDIFYDSVEPSLDKEVLVQ